MKKYVVAICSLLLISLCFTPEMSYAQKNKSSQNKDKSAYNLEVDDTLWALDFAGIGAHAWVVKIDKNDSGIENTILHKSFKKEYWKGVSYSCNPTKSVTFAVNNAGETYINVIKQAWFKASNIPIKGVKRLQYSDTTFNSFTTGLGTGDAPKIEYTFTDAEGNTDGKVYDAEIVENKYVYFNIPNDSSLDRINVKFSAQNFGRRVGSPKLTIVEIW